MKKEIDANFQNRNTHKGFLRYLSTLGFDVSRSYEIVKGPTSKTVYIVQDAAMKIADGGDIKVEDDGTAKLFKLLSDMGGIAFHIADLLINAGFDTVTKLRDASDAELEAIKGISTHRISSIRKLTK